MKDSALEFLVITLSKIEAIAAELPRIGKQSELKVKADEIMKLTETPNLGQMFGGVMIAQMNSDEHPGHQVRRQSGDKGAKAKQEDEFTRE